MPKQHKIQQQGYHSFLKQDEKQNIAKHQQKIKKKRDNKRYLESDLETQSCELTKSIEKQKYKQSLLEQLRTGLKDKNYINILKSQFNNRQQILNFYTHQLPNNTTVVNNQQQGSRHYLIQNISRNISKSKAYSYINQTIQKIIQGTEQIWKHLRIPQSIDLSNSSSNNSQKIIKNMYDDLHALQQVYGIQIYQKLMPQKMQIEKLLKNIIYQYTNNLYTSIRSTFTSRNIFILKRSSYLFQVLLSNFKYKIHGEEVGSNIDLYRNVAINKDIFKLYKKNYILCFTNLTSASKTNLKELIQSKTEDDYHILFVFKLQNIALQKRRKFYTGLHIQNISAVWREDQVLIFPYQFFIIDYIVQKDYDKYQVGLKQHNCNSFIIKLQSPCPSLSQSKKNIQEKDEIDCKQLLLQVEKELKVSKEKIDRKSNNLQIIKQKQQNLKAQQAQQTQQASKSQSIQDNIIFEDKNQQQQQNLLDSAISTQQMNQKSYVQCLAAIDSQTSSQKYKQLVKDVINEKHLDFIAQNSQLINKQNSQNTLNNLQIHPGLTFTQLMNSLEKLLNSSNKQAILVPNLPPALHKVCMQRFKIMKKTNIFKINYKITNHDFTNRIFQEQFRKYSLILSEDNYLQFFIRQLEQFYELIVQTSIQQPQFIPRVNQFIKQCKVVQMINFQAFNKSNTLILSKDILDKAGNRFYNKLLNARKFRGGYMYQMPRNSLRIGLKVENLYQNNKWLNDNTKGWAVVYTSFIDVILNKQLEGEPNDNPKTVKRYQKISKNSIHGCALFSMLIRDLSWVTLNNEKVCLGLQCRVNPDELQYSKKNPYYYYIDRSKAKQIRPYGIILKKKQ